MIIIDLEELIIRNATNEDISKIVDIKVSGWKKDFLKLGETNYPTVSYIYDLRSDNK